MANKDAVSEGGEQRLVAGYGIEHFLAAAGVLAFLYAAIYLVTGDLTMLQAVGGGLGIFVLQLFNGRPPSLIEGR